MFVFSQLETRFHLARHGPNWKDWARKLPQGPLLLTAGGDAPRDKDGLPLAYPLAKVMRATTPGWFSAGDIKTLNARGFAPSAVPPPPPPPPSDRPGALSQIERFRFVQSLDLRESGAVGAATANAIVAGMRSLEKVAVRLDVDRPIEPGVWSLFEGLRARPQRSIVQLEVDFKTVLD